MSCCVLLFHFLCNKQLFQLYPKGKSSCGSLFPCTAVFLVSLGCVLFHANGLGGVCCDLFNSWQVKPPCPRYASADSDVEGRRCPDDIKSKYPPWWAFLIQELSFIHHPADMESSWHQLVLSLTLIPEGWIEQSFYSRTLGSDVQKGLYSPPWFTDIWVGSRVSKRSFFHIFNMQIDEWAQLSIHCFQHTWHRWCCSHCHAKTGGLMTRNSLSFHLHRAEMMAG